MLDDVKWQDAVKNAVHYKAIGQNNIYLFGTDDDRPWQYVTSCEAGGTHRLDISTDVRFKADHPCGLTFSWSFDIEPRDANGKSGYHIDVDAIQRVMVKLPMAAMHSFSQYLLDCSKAVNKRAAEFQAEAKKQYGCAEVLKNAAHLPESAFVGKG